MLRFPELCDPSPSEEVVHQLGVSSKALRQLLGIPHLKLDTDLAGSDGPGLDLA